MIATGPRDSAESALPSGGVTRLAPSPTGALHLGNARTFLLNWALARLHGWKIILRIEDLDTPRVKAGAIESTVRTLRALGLDWDHGPIIQSDDLAPYQHAMDTLCRSGMAYESATTRGELEEMLDQGAASAPQEGSHEVAFPARLRPAIVPGPFVRRGEEEKSRSNWRFATPAGSVTFVDAFAGPQSIDPSLIVGDFPLWTKRDQPSYQLAVVVDDARQGVTHIVRGNDLLDSAARQMLLYRALGLSPEPSYTHLPLVRGPDGKRLAKRHGDSRIERYLEQGCPPGRIIALLARWSGVLDSDDPGSDLSAREFADRLGRAGDGIGNAGGGGLGVVPRTDIIFTAEDHAWLLAR